MLSSRAHGRTLAPLAPFLVLLAACGTSNGPGAASDTARATGSDPATIASTVSVEITEPADASAVAGGVELSMTANGITIEKAGTVRDNAGHFHVIADADCVATGTAIPRDADHVHLGDGQAEATIYLEPGTHQLCVQAGDGAHVALDATDTVTVTVGIVDRAQWCTVIGEVTELFGNNDEDTIAFAERQVGYENIRRLIAQLSDGLDQVDAGSRDDVAPELEFGRTWAQAYIDADDYQAAAANATDLYQDGSPESGGRGATWVFDNCGVRIAG